jgi:hypothetical protein
MGPLDATAGRARQEAGRMAIHRSSRAVVCDVDERRRVGRRAAALLALGAALLIAGEGAAQGPEGAPVKLAEVSSQVDARATRLADVVGLLRRDAEGELAAIDWSKAPMRRRYLVSAVLVKLESARAGDHALRASCTVSAAVRDDRGELLAIVQGRAGAEGPPAAAAQAEREALAAAVRSAIAAVPESIRRAQ